MKVIFRKIDWNNVYTDDIEKLLKWANSTLSTKINTEKEITKSEHLNWIATRNNKNTDLWIIEVDTVKIGQVRLNKKREDYFVDIFVATAYRGKNIAYKAIEYVKDYCFDKDPQSLFIAIVKENNYKSQALFVSLNPDHLIKNNKLIHYIWETDESLLRSVRKTVAYYKYCLQN